MNKKLILIIILTQLASHSIKADIFDDIKKGVKKAIKETKKAADKAIDKTKDIAEDAIDVLKKEGKKAGDSASDLLKQAKNDFKDAFNKVAECSEVVRLSAEFAAKKTEYFAIQTALQAAKVSLTAAQKTADLGLAISSEVADIAGKLLSQTLVIKKAYGRIAVADFAKGKLPTFDVDLIVAGKEFTVSVDWDLTDALQMAQSLAQSVKNKLPSLPFKIPVKIPGL